MSSSRFASLPDDPPIIGRYRVYGDLAAGGMATVHFAKLMGAAGFARVVALKRLHRHLASEPQFRAMLLDEARLSARVNHPNVVRTLDVIDDGDDVVIVMEYVPGESLARAASLARDRERVPMDVAVAIVVGVLNGLHAAHEARDASGAPLAIVHRDVSPQNILIGVDGAAHVIDFGIAKAASRLTSTTDGVAKGKRRYMAPEQLLGETVSRATDVYSAGVVLWELLAGAPLFDGPEAEGIIARATTDVTRAPSSAVAGVPEALDAIVLRALARTPRARFATARAMAEDLARALSPATPDAVAAWLHRVAGDAVEIAEERVALIERHEPREEIRSSVASARSLEGLAMAPAPRSPWYASARARTTAVALAALGIAVFFIAGGLGPRSARRSPDVQVGAAQSPASLWPSSSAAPSAEWTAASDVALAVHAPSSAAAPTAAPDPLRVLGAPLAASTKALSPSAPRAPRSAPSAGTSPAQALCSPPFSFDADGHKIYKPECFH
jgi:serine/threonine protein kinase